MLTFDLMNRNMGCVLQDEVIRIPALIKRIACDVHLYNKLSQVYSPRKELLDREACERVEEVTVIYKIDSIQVL